jgi:hypothetical protein
MVTENSKTNEGWCDMWHDLSSLADQRLQELYEDASVRRSLPPKPRHLPMLREVLGRALVRWGERLARPVGSSVAHR